jgi:hypothetical protein
MNIRNRDVQNETVRGITTNAIMVKAFVINNGNTGTSTDVDWSKCLIKLVLNRNGMQEVIMQDNAKILGLASQVDQVLQLAFGGAANDVTPSSLGVLLPFIIPFGGHINLKGDDSLYLEITNQAGLFTAGVEQSSYIETKLIKSIGYEQFIPSIRSHVVQATETQRKYDMGDNVIRTVVLNYDKTDFTNNVINSLTFTSDRLNENYTFADLVTLKLSRYGKQLIGYSNPDISARIQQDQCFVLTDFNHNFNALEIDIAFNSGQVTSSNNYIVCWSYRTDNTILEKANNLQAKHIRKAQDAVPAAAPKK